MQYNHCEKLCYYETCIAVEKSQCHMTTDISMHDQDWQKLQLCECCLDDVQKCQYDYVCSGRLMQMVLQYRYQH